MSLPHGIDLDQYKTQAKELLKNAKLANPEALDRIRQHHPENSTILGGGRIQLADAQLVIARELDYGSWAKLKEDLIFLNAVAALDAGDIPRLTAILKDNPSVIHYQCRTGMWYKEGYFQGAALLHHVAGNPIRYPIPANILDVTRFLLEHGADPNVKTDDGGTTIGLLLTSKQASEAGVAVPLMDMLRVSGAMVDLNDPEMLTMPLLNVAPATAEELILRGAKVDIRHAAALGHLDVLNDLLEEGVEQALLEEALVFACVRGQEEAARVLIQHGAKGDVLVTPGGQTARTALHEAANRGHMEIVRLMLENGTDSGVVEPCWNGTAYGWAIHGGHHDIAELIQQYANKLRKD